MKFNGLLKGIILLTILVVGQTSFAAFSTEAQMQYNKGLDYYNSGQLQESVKCFQQAIELNPNYIDAYYNLGSIMEYLNNNNAALEAFKQIILRKPDDYEAVLKAAEISKRLGQLDKSKMYLTLIPTDTVIGQRAAQLNKAIIEQEKMLQEQTQNAIDLTQNSFNEAVNQLQNTVEQFTTPVQETVSAVQEEVVEQKSLISNTDGKYDNITSPTGIVTDSKGNLYVANFADNIVYKIDPSNNKIVYIKDSKINGPIGMAIDKFDNIYIANYNKDNVIKVSNNGTISTFISNISKPYCMHITADLLFVSSQGSNSVVRKKLVY